MDRRPTILIVDDEPFNIAVLEQELADLDYDTVSAADGQEALDQVEAVAPDLVLLDVMMPVMDGFAVLSRLKAAAATRDIPVVIISALNDIKSVVNGIERGAEDYLPKPFDPVLLQARIGACLEKKRLRDQEVEYLRQVERLTRAAADVESSVYDAAGLDPVAARADALGNLARVFQRMAREVHAREERLKRQLRQVQLDVEERDRAAAETAAVYVPMDRRQALVRGDRLPEHGRGSALVVDVAGFTALTAALAHELGLQRGAEEVTRELNRVFDALIERVHHFGGSAVEFAGDAMICWFADDDGGRAAASAFAMQDAMAPFATVTTAGGTALPLAIKVAVATGACRRFLVGDPEIQHFEVLAGRLLEELALGERLATHGEVLVSSATADALGSWTEVIERRHAPDGQQFAVVGRVDGAAGPAAAPWPDLPAGVPSDDLARPWLAPAVFERVRTGKTEFLAELRPAATVFLSFRGLDYDGDPDAGSTLDAFVRWVQSVLRRYDGTLIQVTIGDKGSYLFAAFGAPAAHDDDADRAVAAALDLQTPPGELTAITEIRIAVTLGQMRAGAYGGTAQRTYGVQGDKTNLAAHLMQAAADGILCDEAIYRAARSAITFEATPPARVKGRAEPIAVYRPVSVSPRGAVAGRFDQLPPAQQLVLKVASVIGRTFSARALHDIYPVDEDRPHLDAHLNALEWTGFLGRAGSGDDATWMFGDSLVQDRAYELLLFAQRRRLHRALAEWYEATSADDLASRFALLADHWTKADEPAKAVAYLERAGQAARERGEHQEAERFFRASLALDADAATLGADFSFEKAAVRGPAGDR